MGRWRLIILLITTIVIMVSCSVSRHIPEGEYLIHKVVVHQDSTATRSELIPSDELEKYVRQTPNRRLLGFNFYLWVYNLANPDKTNWWNNFLRSIGEEPVCLNQDLTENSVRNMKIYLDSHGFYSSEVEAKIDTLTRSRRVKIEYFTSQGKPFTVNNFEYEFRDSLLAPIILADTSQRLVRNGSIFSVTLLDKERERIATSLRERGYFGFSVRNIEYEADTLVGNHTANLKLIVNKNIDGYDNRGRPIYSNNAIYLIADVNIAPNYDPSIIINDDYLNHKVDTTKYRGLNIVHEKGEKINVRPNVLRQMTPLQEGDIFDSRDVDISYRNLMSLGYFKSARISFVPLAESAPPANSLVLMTMDRLKRGEGDVITQSPVRQLSANVLATPALRQSYSIELEGSTTSSFYGLYATVGYQNRNIFKGAESWSVDLMGGYEHMKADNVEKNKATELALSTSLAFPRFLLPFANDILPRAIRPQTKVELSVNLQDRPYYERTLSSASWSYSWRNRGLSNFVVTPIDINIVDLKYIDADYYDSLTNDYLRNSYETQLLAGIAIGYTYNNQPRNLRGGATMLRFNAETSGNLIDGFVKAFDSEPVESDGGNESYEIFGIKYAQYARASLEISHKYPFGNNFAIATRLYGGAGVAYGNSTSIPFDRLFYSGGSNSMRGWSPRTLGPGSSEIPEDDVYPSQVGDMKLEANIEFRFPIWSMFHGATFLDAGNIWYLSNSSGIDDESSIFHPKSFYKQLGFNTGVGLRIDIQFVVIRLDWGIQLHNPNEPLGDRWVIRNFDFSNTSLNFGVGYPF
ncbi:MAG: BamA/TamA family outer membrane protein [Rikenellaceae bacterium]